MTFFHCKSDLKWVLFIILVNMVPYRTESVTHQVAAAGYHSQLTVLERKCDKWVSFFPSWEIQFLPIKCHKTHGKILFPQRFFGSSTFVNNLSFSFDLIGSSDINESMENGPGLLILPQSVVHSKLF